MPAITTKLATTALLRGRERKMIQASKMTQMGSVNCRTIAFAAVVSLLAMTKVSSMAKSSTAPPMICLLT